MSTHQLKRRVENLEKTVPAEINPISDMFKRAVIGATSEERNRILRYIGKGVAYLKGGGGGGWVKALTTKEHEDLRMILTTGVQRYQHQQAALESREPVATPPTEPQEPETLRPCACKDSDNLGGREDDDRDETIGTEIIQDDAEADEFVPVIGTIGRSDGQ